MFEGKRIAILAEEGFEDAELMEPMRAMVWTPGCIPGI